MPEMWMVRAGENAYLIDAFKDLNVVAIGWEVGDLSGKSPDEIKQIMKDTYPKASNTSLGNNAAQVIKFVCDFKIGDYVISYSPLDRKYLVGIITSDYYFSDKLADRVILNKYGDFYHNIRDVKWIGETNRDDLKDTASKPLKAIMTIFNVNWSAKTDILKKMNPGKIEWTDFYMEFADKLLEYKNNRKALISKIYKIYDDLDLKVPNLGGDVVIGDVTIPFDMDPFTIFALFNNHSSTERRIRFVEKIKEEFSIESDAPYTFHGIALVNNLKATFYWSSEGRKEDDVDNLWNLFECALNFSSETVDQFCSIYDKVINQKGILWNITMGLNWIRPFNFINLDANNRETLSSDEIFPDELKNEIKSLKRPPKAEQYLHICDEVMSILRNTDKFNNLPELSHGAYVSKLNGNDDESDEGIGDSDVRPTHYWLISPGAGASFWDDFYENGEMGIGFDGTGDLNQYNSKEELKHKFQEMHNDRSSHKNNVHACWQFVHDMQVGDVVFAKNGMSEIIGRGIVESEYQYDASKPYHKIRKVRWTHRGNWPAPEKLPMKTLTDITIYTEFVNNIKELFVSVDEDEPEIEEIEYPVYDSEKFLEDVYIDEDDYQTLVKLLENKKNLIVQGAPGVGKTFMAKRLAYSMMGVKDVERVMMVQFHQSYSYEDFVMGYRPSKEGFELRNGLFYNFCKTAEEDSDNDYFFIIDEINRGNISKIFGELFMLIESDKRGDKNKIQLLYSDELFYIPKNVHIIGLMNTADRSLAMLDYALRRRFAFFDLKPGFDSDGFRKYQEKLSDNKFDKLIEVMKELNHDIKEDESLGEGFRIGHSYLCNIKDENIHEKLSYIVDYELIPLLKEYWFDENEKIDYWSDRLRSVLND
ncbi:MAG: AAA family ATPase [Methanobrevibacter sp.]|nr:AAA family ATPase [Methanobrevibacter sp.]